MATRNKLTALEVKAKVEPGYYGDGGGLWLQVKRREWRSWVFRFTVDGRRFEMGLGSADDVTLAKARDLAGDARKLLEARKNPLTERRSARAKEAADAAAKTFRSVADQYLAAHEGTWRNAKHKYQWRQTLDSYILPAFGDTPVKDVETEHVMKALEPIWTSKPETAARVRGRIETVLDYAKSMNWRTGDNPARWRGHISNLLPPRSRVGAVEHHAALPWGQIGAFMLDLAAQAGTSAQALQFTILTAARTTEALEARWQEIDLHTATWTVPPGRMKAGRLHRVPLSPEAAAVLERRKTEAAADPHAFLFPGAKPKAPLSNTAMIMLLRRMGRGELTVHGFRSTFRDWAAESTGYAREVAEAALAHTLKDKTEAAYQRGDLLEKRRRLMNDWAAFCGRPAPSQADVVPIRQTG